jgi:uncharacterized RDD family membrane protein YckC
LAADVPPRTNPLSVRLLGAGVRGARSVTKVAGIDRAVEAAAEEAMVAAVESEAVERALARVLQGPVVENAVHGALDSETVKRALVEALDSEMVDEVWRRLLASDEAQKLVERIAEAPEIRAAISAQSVGLIQDVGNTVSGAARRVDGGVERAGRRLVFRKPRPEPTNHAGALTRGLAFALDGLIVNLAFSGFAALVALIASAFTGSNDAMPALTIAFGSFAWFAIGAVYLVGFWTLAGKTPGMHFLDIRIGPDGERLRLGRAIKRLFGLALAIIPFGLGLVGIVLREDRRGWQDRLADTDVLYEPEERRAAPWSTLRPEPEPTVAEAAAAANPPTGRAPPRRGERGEPSGPNTTL